MKHLALALLIAACSPEPDHVAAAQRVTELYAESKFKVWEIQAFAAGEDCRVLIVDLGIVVNDSMLESLHYGEGEYGVTPGGFQRFSLENGFRGIAYRDDDGSTWASGDLRRREGDEPIDVGHGVNRLKPRDADKVLGRIVDCGVRLARDSFNPSLRESTPQTPPFRAWNLCASRNTPASEVS